MPATTEARDERRPIETRGVLPGPLRRPIIEQQDPNYNWPMRYWLVQWLLSGVALLIVARIVPGIQVDSFGAALIAAVVIGLAGATVGLILKLVLLPFIVLTLGVVYLLINGLMLKLASEFVPGFRVNGCLPAVLGAILLSLVDYVLSRLVGL